MKPKLLGSLEASRILGVTPDRVRQMARAGQLPYDLVAGRRLFKERDMREAATRRQSRLLESGAGR